MKLTSEAVEKLFDECVVPADTAGDQIKAVGLVNAYWFDRKKIEQNKPKIRELLAELPDNFRADKGGGWTFLNACIDRNGEQWTGLHQTMEKLFCLGIAAGITKWLMLDMAASMPGGVPYVSVSV
jgi:hypothetical protein